MTVRTESNVSILCLATADDAHLSESKEETPLTDKDVAVTTPDEAAAGTAEAKPRAVSAKSHIFRKSKVDSSR